MCKRRGQNLEHHIYQKDKFRYLHNFFIAYNTNYQQGSKLKLSNKIYKLPNE